MNERDRYSTLLFSLFLCVFTTYLLVQNSKSVEPQIIVVTQHRFSNPEIDKKHKRIHFVTRDETIIADAYFEIGAYEPAPNEYHYKQYMEAEKRIRNFLEACNDLFSDGDIVSVDGLKFKKIESSFVFAKNDPNYSRAVWEPFPNPPMPVLEPGESRIKHVQEYAEWINRHPHFGYPPIPLTGIH